jgi:hypothetical protein
MRTYIGIDPGLDGAVAFIQEGRAPFLFDTPTMDIGTKRDYDMVGMVSIFNGVDVSAARVAIEDVHSMPKQGVVSCFTFGKGFGIWLGIIGALGLTYSRIRPERWKKSLMDGMPKEKDSSRLRAQQLFPTAEITLKKHHGRADALLLAEYVRRQEPHNEGAD